MILPGSGRIAILVCLLAAGSAWGQPEAQGQSYRHGRLFWASTERVVDGITAIFPQGVCRLAGLDAPVAPQQEAGEEPRRLKARADLAEQSRRALQDLLGQAPALIVDFGPDRQGRMICVILTAAGENVNLEMVRSGWAEAYLLPGSPFATVLQEAEERAWEAKSGVWAFPHYRRARDERKRLRGGSQPSERSAPNYWDTVPDPGRLRAPPCVDPSCR